MTIRRLVSFAAAVLFVPASVLRADTPVDPSGHWEGTALVQRMDLPFHVDIWRTSPGDYTGTISIPSENIHGLPLLKVSVDGATIGFHARTDQPFTGTIAADGHTISGEMVLSGTTFPVALTRTSTAVVEPALTSAPIAKALEGTWAATLESGGPVHVILTMTNHADGTATGVLTNLDEGELRLPVAIAQHDSIVTLEIRVVSASFSGTLSADGATLVGTFHEKGKDVPVTFRREAGTAKR